LKLWDFVVNIGKENDKLSEKQLTCCIRNHCDFNKNLLGLVTMTIIVLAAWGVTIIKIYENSVRENTRIPLFRRERPDNISTP
jgi:hypothetical protein